MWWGWREVISLQVALRFIWTVSIHLISLEIIYDWDVLLHGYVGKSDVAPFKITNSQKFFQFLSIHQPLKSDYRICRTLVGSNVTCLIAISSNCKMDKSLSDANKCHKICQDSSSGMLSSWTMQRTSDNASDEDPSRYEHAGTYWSLSNECCHLAQIRDVFWSLTRDSW